MIQTHILVKNQFIDFHRWESAPEEVDFLRNLHRHVFKVETTIEVRQNDRDIEFFILQKQIDNLIKTFVIPMPETKSCEMMAEVIVRQLAAVYPKRLIQALVSEDGENAAIVTLSPEYD